MSDSALERALVDTNVVIYAHDPTDLAKHETAQQLLEMLSDAGCLAYSAQVFNEFCSNMMRPNRDPHLTPAQAREVVGDLRTTGDVFPVTAEMTQRALDGMIAYGISFWDALLWAAARENGIPIIYTEDMPGMPVIEGVRYINPFADEPNHDVETAI